MLVIPAKAGIHGDFSPMESKATWTPAFAGVTEVGVDQSFPNARVATAESWNRREHIPTPNGPRA